MAFDKNGFASTADRPEGGIVGISNIAQGCVKGLRIGCVQLGAQCKPTGEIGVGNKRPSKCDSVRVPAGKDFLCRFLDKPVIRDEHHKDTKGTKD